MLPPALIMHLRYTSIPRLYKTFRGYYNYFCNKNATLYSVNYLNAKKASHHGCAVQQLYHIAVRTVYFIHWSEAKTHGWELIH